MQDAEWIDSAGSRIRRRSSRRSDLNQREVDTCSISEITKHGGEFSLCHG